VTIRKLTEADVEFTVRVEQDDTPVRGNAMASGDDAADRECEDEILSRLEAGNVEAWCVLTVEDPVAYARGYDMHKNALAALNEEFAQAQQIKTVRMCATKYLGPTDTRGSRVKATHITTRKSVTVPWDHALDSFDNHATAAGLLFGRRPELSSSIDGGGYMFVVDPANDGE
jgi:hypothetical protein